MRSLWTGSINFGLVNIPVKMYSASETTSLDLDMLRKSDQCHIKYKRVCETDGQEVEYSEIVKGFEYSDGEYVILTDKDFENANIEKTKTLDIQDFVNENEIDVRFYEKPYYLEPDRSGAKPYALLREALIKSKKVGIASYVLRNKGSIGVIKPVKGVLVLNQLRFASELRDFGSLKLPDSNNIKDKEIELALTLIDQLAGKFKPEQYKDTYTDDLKKIIENKALGKKITPKGKTPKPSKVIDMMELLKQSLKENKKKKAA